MIRRYLALIVVSLLLPATAPRDSPDRISYSNCQAKNGY